jgi:hypothetical protein
MKFRMIWLGHEDDPEGQACVAQSCSAVGDGALYEQRGTDMVRRKRSRIGSVEHVRIANFVARILGDIAYDEGPGKLADWIVERGTVE